MRLTSKRQRSGFTLVEVLVAMAILAVALSAASRAAALTIRHNSEIKLRILADMVAQNRLAERNANDAWLAAGTYNGTASQAGISFKWKEEVTPTPNPAFMKIVVTVADPVDDKHSLRRLSGFLVNPAFQYGP